MSESGGDRKREKNVIDEGNQRREWRDERKDIGKQIEILSDLKIKINFKL